MSRLQRLRDAKTLDEVAGMLGFTPSGLAFVMYRLSDRLKYRSFQIPKRSGGTRLIQAPAPMLNLLQRRLADLLYDCIAEIQRTGSTRRSLAHGFERSRSIYTNASLHKRRRYVLNLDLQDFFPSINFGRVRGFFIKDQHFSLHEKVATVLAQISCHDNELPQGSPCSPVISNLIGHILDARLAGFAKSHKCTYSRYADDITFSTSQKEFPAELAFLVSGTASQWQLGQPLVDKIEGAGFTINSGKTRMQIRGSRQIATGLMLNEKVNIRPEYYRLARSMCNQLFTTGSYYRIVPATLAGGKIDDGPVKRKFDTLNSLEGILAHIHYVKDRADSRSSAEKKKTPTSARRLHRKFLFYKHFVGLDAPLLLTEGKTDAIYIRLAIKMSSSYHPKLGKFDDGRFVSVVRFLNYSRVIHDLLHLGGGTGDLAAFIGKYHASLSAFQHAPLSHPVIVIVDNDDGAKAVFSACKGKCRTIISHGSSELFYHLGANLYLVKTPEIGADSKSCIEELFDPALRAEVIDGKAFDPSKEHGDETKYGKFIFAERVVKPKAATMDFSGFAPLLERIVAVLDDYKARGAVSVAA